MARRSPLAALEQWFGPARTLRWLLRVYPPYVGAGIHAEVVREDMAQVVMRMDMRWWNRNYVGTHFGGSLFAMCDPVFMLLLLRHLGREFEVWDKAATIRFKRPGRGTVRATFDVPPELVDDLRARVPNPGDRYDATLSAVVRDEAGTVIAEVEKVIFIRRKAKSERVA